MSDNDLETRWERQTALDADLVRRAQAGDTKAFSLLVRGYQRRAVSVAWRILGNLEDASDVSQEAFVRTYRNLAQLADAEKFGSWLLRTVSNLALNFRRSRGIRRGIALEDAGDLPERGCQEVDPPRVGLAGTTGASMPDELNRAISAAITKLPEQQRLALILFSVEGMPQKEVAEVLECTVELVKWNVFQARKKLKAALADYL